MNDLRSTTQRALDRLKRAADTLGRDVKLMEVCGTHTMSAFRSGLHALIPDNVKLISGPGCPVCVTAQGDIDQMIAISGEPDVVLCTYGDMMRVPGKHGSLEAMRCKGARIEVIYSTLEAVQLAQRQPNSRVVLAAVGFETTTPPTAAAIDAAAKLGLKNFSVLASHKLVVPAMTALLDSVGDDTTGIEGFLCPGHVSVIIGSDAYQPLIDTYRMPCVIGGFEPMLMADGMASLVEQVVAGEAKLENLYPEAVTPGGNPVAQELIDRIFEPDEVRWRGVGPIPGSGLAIRDEYAAYDARKVFALDDMPDREPNGCICGQVIAGLANPDGCSLFGTVCTPVRPIGPCMVSGEGTCQAWFKYQRPAIAARGRVAKEVVTA